MKKEQMHEAREKQRAMQRLDGRTVKHKARKWGDSVESEANIDPPTRRKKFLNF